MLWKYVLRTRKFWLLGLLAVAGALATVGTDAVLTGWGHDLPLMTATTLGLTCIPALALVLVIGQVLGWLPDGFLGWAAPVGVIYGLVGVGLLGWWGYRRWQRL
ncbi:MAG: hypothetical protein Q6L50_04070 [Gloeomargarita sp. GMQP_bins_120]